MQEITKNVEYFMKISSQINNLEAALNEQSVPFCILQLVYKNNKPYDIKLYYFNKAFHEIINPNATIGQLIGPVSSKALDYWLGPLELVAKTKTELVCNNYIVHNERITFGKVTIFPFNSMGGNTFGMVLERPTYRTNSLCLKCPNNPEVQRPSLKMVAVTVEDSGHSVCEICQTVRSLPFPTP
jgi:hypothetical protein